MGVNFIRQFVAAGVDMTNAQAAFDYVLQVWV
jgi:hypothetical protein